MHNTRHNQQPRQYCVPRAIATEPQMARRRAGRCERYRLQSSVSERLCAYCGRCTALPQISEGVQQHTIRCHILRTKHLVPDWHGSLCDSKTCLGMHNWQYMRGIRRSKPCRLCCSRSLWTVNSETFHQLRPSRQRSPHRFCTMGMSLRLRDGLGQGRNRLHS